MLDTDIEHLFNTKFYMKQYGNFSMQEMNEMYPFELDINYFLTIAHQKKLREAKG